MMQRIVWQRKDRERTGMAQVSFVGVLGFSLLSASIGEAATCKVGGPAPTHGTIDSAVDDANCSLVKVAKGTYTEYVTITRSVELVGSGTGTIIKAPGGGAIVSISGNGVQAEVRSFTISGPVPEGTTSLTGVWVGDNAGAEIRNNTITDIRESTFSGIGTHQDFDAVIVDGNSGGTATIVNNTVQGYQKGGIVVDGVGPLSTVANNRVFGSVRSDPALPTPYGIQVNRGATAKVRSNRVFDNGHTSSGVLSVGILLFEAGAGTEVTSNTVIGNDTGICVKQTSGASIEQNNVSDSAFDGIALDNQDPALTTNNNTVRRNTVMRNGEGITLFSANNNVVEMNTASNNNGAGLFVSCDDDGTGCTQPPSSGNAITKNTANFNGIEGFRDESTGLGTGGTANAYSSNKCNNNGVEGSNPDGLCLPQQP